MRRVRSSSKRLSARSAAMRRVGADHASSLRRQHAQVRLPDPWSEEADRVASSEANRIWKL